MHEGRTHGGPEHQAEGEERDLGGAHGSPVPPGSRAHRVRASVAATAADVNLARARILGVRAPLSDGSARARRPPGSPARCAENRPVGHPGRAERPPSLCTAAPGLVISPASAVRSAVVPVAQPRAPGLEARPLRDPRSDPGVPRPARGRVLAPVQHRVPGGLSRRHQLPGLPQPRRRGAVRGGLHPRPRAEPGRGDVLVCLLGPVRARVPPRRHRPPAGDPGDEAVPRGVARGVRDPGRDARHHAARGARRGDRRRPRGPRGGRELATRGYQVTVYDSLPFGGGTMLIGVPAFRLPREAIEMDVRLVERLGVTFVSTPPIGIDVPFEDLQRDYDAIAITAGAMNPVYLDVPGADLDGVKYGIDFMKLANLGQELDRRQERRRHRRRLHRHGLLAHEPPVRRRERHHRLPAHALRAGRRRGGAGRDRARGRAPGVPRQPDRAHRRGRQAHRRAVHPQQARRAGRLRPPLAGADPGLRVHRPGRHRHPGGLPGGGPLVPAGGRRASRSTAAGSRWTRRPTRRTSAASSPAATS